MNELMSGNIITMDSREIAELTNKKHNHVLRDIERNLSKVCTLPNFGDTYIHLNNKQEHKCYKLPKRETLILVSGYSVELRAKIIDRLEFLEKICKPQVPRLPQTYSEALRELASAVEENEQLKLNEVQNAPKVQLAEKCLRTDQQMCIRDAGKHLKLSQTEIFKIMRDNKYLTLKGVPTQKALDRKVLTVKTGNKDGKNWTRAYMNMENIMNFQDRHLKPIPVQGCLLEVSNG